MGQFLVASVICILALNICIVAGNLGAGDGIGPFNGNGGPFSGIGNGPYSGNGPFSGAGNGPFVGIGPGPFGGANGHFSGIGNDNGPFGGVHGEDGGRYPLSTIFRRWDIVPDYLALAPKELLEITYDGTVRPRLGTEIPVCDLGLAPALRWNCDSNELYAITMVDLYPLGMDTFELLSEGRHWLLVDVPGCDLASGITLVEYLRPLPRYGAGLNRYLMVVFEQPQNVVPWAEPYVNATTVEHRFYTSIQKLADKYNLGRAAAANFFQTQYDECIDLNFAALDPAPEYVNDAVERAGLPQQPIKKKNNKITNTKITTDKKKKSP